MSNNTFVTFNLHGLLFAVDVKAVKEIMWLPELTIIEELPRFITGVINLHGGIVPVMDILLRLGHNPKRYHCSDRLIILDLERLHDEDTCRQTLPLTSGSRAGPVGIIATEVLDVLDLYEKEIGFPAFQAETNKSRSSIIGSEAKIGDEIFMVIDPCKLFDSEIPADEIESDKHESIREKVYGYFSPESEPEERAVFHNRAVNLRQAVADMGSEKLRPAAVVSLNNEYLCVELDAVREFSKLRNFTHIPCCPEHIAGNMNYRGTVLTVIDIRGILNMKSGSAGKSAKVIVADTGEYHVGVIVDDILDVIYLDDDGIVPVPPSLSVMNGKFVKGAADYGNRLMPVLDFKEILSWDGLTVDDEVQ